MPKVRLKTIYQVIEKWGCCHAGVVNTVGQIVV